MNWKPQIFKPKWQHKDAEIRRTAVATEQDPELLAELGAICLDDEDASVRAIAARRLGDLEILATALAREKNKSALSSIEERMRQLAASVAADRPPLKVRQKVVAASADRELLEAVASNAPEGEMRKLALARISRQGFLGDRALNDPDPEIRRLAAAAVTQHSTLRRVIAESRTTDKSLHHDLEKRLHKELLEAGDRDALDNEALIICQAVEHAALQKAPADERQIAGFEAQWARLKGQARPEHQQRFEQDIALLRGIGAEAEPPAVPAPSATSAQPDSGTEPPTPGAAPPTEPETGVALPTAPETGAAPPTESEPKPAAAPPADAPASAVLLEAVQIIRDFAGSAPGKLDTTKLSDLEQRWSTAWNGLPEPNPAEQLLGAEAGELLAKTRRKLEAAATRRDALLDIGGKLVERLGEELEQGELHKALETRLELQKLGKKISKDKRWKAIQKKVNSMQGRLRELRGWQHWSNDKIRKRMIKEMEALPAAGLHPDAVLERIKELQGNWKELEASEQIPGDKHFAAAPWMWRKFNAAGRKAFETTKPFLDKRTEIQKRHLNDMRELITNISELAASETPDWPALGKALAKARREMRSLGEVPAKARHKMAGKLKAALDTGNQAMQANYEVIEKKKRKLIREAMQLAHVVDRDEAISTAKSLQAEWKAAGALWRSRENQLWKEFREPLDPLFENLKAERQSVREERSALLEEQKVLCRDLKAILKLDDAELPGQHGRIQGLKDGWKDIRHPDRRLQQDFQKLVEQYQARLKAQEREAENTTRVRWWDKADLLHQAEAAQRKGSLDEKLEAKLKKAWPQADQRVELEETLDRRFAAALDAKRKPADDPATEETARKLCICLEFLAGIPSPDKEKDLRMQYQVDRLSESLSGERQRMSAVEEARMLEQDWLALPFLPTRKFNAMKKRAKAAIDSIIMGI